MKDASIKLIVADDHPVFREGICSTIKELPFIASIRQASNGNEVIDHLQSELADLVILDIKMEPLNGIEASAIIRERFPSVKMIALSMFSEEKYILELVKHGVSGYLIKNAGKQELIDAITTVMEGQNYFTRNVSGILYNKLSKLTTEAQGEGVASSGRRERMEEIIYLMCMEKTSSEIGEILFLSKRTIEEYRVEIMKITNSKNVAGVVKYALEKGIPDDMVVKYRVEKYLGRRK